jgi:hypothetical protein
MGWCGPATDDNQNYKVGQNDVKYAGIGPFGCDLTEDTVSYPISGGTLTKFQCRWSDSPGNNKSYTCQLRVNGQDIAGATCTISGNNLTVAQKQCTVAGPIAGIPAGNASVMVTPTGNPTGTNFGFRGTLTP